MEVAALVLFLKGFFGQALHQITTICLAEGHFTMVKNRKTEAEATRNIAANQTVNGAVVSQESKILNQKLAPLSRDSRRLSNKY